MRKGGGVISGLAGWLYEPLINKLSEWGCNIIFFVVVSSLFNGLVARVEQSVCRTSADYAAACIGIKRVCMCCMLGRVLVWLLELSALASLGTNFDTCLTRCRCLHSVGKHGLAGVFLASVPKIKLLRQYLSKEHV